MMMMYIHEICNVSLNWDMLLISCAQCFRFKMSLVLSPIPCFQETQNLALTLLLYISNLSWYVKWIPTCLHVNR